MKLYKLVIVIISLFFIFSCDEATETKDEPFTQEYDICEKDIPEYCENLFSCISSGILSEFGYKSKDDCINHLQPECNNYIDCNSLDKLSLHNCFKDSSNCDKLGELLQYVDFCEESKLSTCLNE